MKNFKRVLSVLLCLVFSASLTIFNAWADSAVAISNYEQLCKIADNLNGNYYLTKDITVPSDSVFEPIGLPSDYFKGTLDGKNYSIFGLKIEAKKSTSGSSAYGGLFGYSAGTVKNLKIEDVEIISENTKWSYVGAVTGVNIGTIENCYVSGTVKNSGIEIAAYTGGIAGQMQKGKISKCVSFANVYNARGELYTGGIVGYIEKGTVSECAVYSSIFANGKDTTMDSYTGGICGFSREGAEYTDCLFAGGIIAEKCANAYLGGVSGKLIGGKVERTVATGSIMPSEIISHTYIGGVAGEELSEPAVKNAFYKKGIINEEITGLYGKELSESAISKKDSFTGFDFNDVWSISDGKIELKNLPKSNKTTDSPSTLTGIKITSKPEKLTYTQGDSALDLRGLEVSAIYSDKTVKLSQNDYAVGGYNCFNSGKQTITVNYQGYTDSFVIEVKKANNNIITISDITQGSYSDGNSDGKVSKNDNKTDSNPSSSSSDTASKTNQVTGPNVITDTMDDDSSTNNVSNGENETNSSEKFENTSSDTAGKIGNKSGLSGAAIALICVGAIIVLAAILVVAFLVVRNKSRKNNRTSEISNDELAEAENDENDIY